MSHCCNESVTWPLRAAPTMRAAMSPEIFPRGLRMKLQAFAVATGVALSLVGASAIAKVDDKLPAYKPATGVSGNFSSVGSDTLNNLMTLWAEEFKRLYPTVNIQIQGAGSST